VSDGHDGDLPPFRRRDPNRDGFIRNADDIGWYVGELTDRNLILRYVNWGHMMRGEVRDVFEQEMTQRGIGWKDMPDVRDRAFHEWLNKI
jgi:hypothetical protein